MKLHFEEDVECTACGGTGLYQGFAEKDGAAVVCYICKGTGKQHVSYTFTKFEKRQTRPNVKRVYKTSGGYAISSKDVVTSSGKKIEFSKGGVSYEDWLKGVEPKPICDLHCPLEHFEQGSYEGEWLKDHHCHENGLHLGGSISDCSKRNRDYCWLEVKKGLIPENIKK